MIAKIAFLCAAFAAVSATGYLAPAVYGTGLALKAPAAPLLAAPLSQSVIATPASYSIQRSVVNHGVAPVAVAAAPLTYTTVAKAAPLAYTTVAKTAPVAYGAPILSHTGILGAAPLAYSDALGHGLAYTTGLGHDVAYTTRLAGHGLAYGPGVLGLSKVGYGKVLL
ncbi:cuticle protein 12.5-like [Stegodyphus dumicola]|uniref:cuticle protein 12.5-like n=1 Tax=Stegodyphus dumicola TaxID=202533 RepID=UPI0015AEEF82|nr:cuticle protein 12.5-like [Stegodyphus dumicola]